MKKPNPPAPFPAREGGASKPLQIKKYIPLPSPCRRGLGRGSGRGLGRGLYPSQLTNRIIYPVRESLMPE